MSWVEVVCYQMTVLKWNVQLAIAVFTSALVDMHASQPVTCRQNAAIPEVVADKRCALCPQ